MNFCVTDFLSDQFFLQEEKVLYLKLVPPLLLCFVLSSNDQIQEEDSQCEVTTHHNSPNVMPSELT